MGFLLKRDGKYFTRRGYTGHASLASIYPDGYARSCVKQMAKVEALRECDIKQIIINDAKIVMMLH